MAFLDVDGKKKRKYRISEDGWTMSLILKLNMSLIGT